MPLNQIRTTDNQRVGRHWGHLPAETMQRVEEGIKISLGLVPLWRVVYDNGFNQVIGGGSIM